MSALFAFLFVLWLIPDGRSEPRALCRNCLGRDTGPLEHHNAHWCRDCGATTPGHWPYLDPEHCKQVLP